VTASNLQSIGQVVAGHVLHRRLGSGMHGTVYLASPAATTRLVALKLMALPTDDTTGTAAKVFLETAAAARALHHPDIVTIHGAGVEVGLAWLTMEPVPGAELGRYTRPPRLLPEALALRVCARLARALAYAHRSGVVHRDVKPANVLVDWPTDTVKLTDFGLARLADGMNTATGLLLGSPAYMAPEQLAGMVPTPGTDLYALGVTLFELLTGQPAYPGGSMGELLRQVAHDAVPDLALLRPDLPAPLADLLRRMLAKASTDRPSDGDAVAQEMQLIAAQLSPRSATPPDEAHRTPA
jgi:serine/threonine-protein kinase